MLAGLEYQKFEVQAMTPAARTIIFAGMLLKMSCNIVVSDTNFL